ncbi:hypothetical protein G7Y89_g2896 [Cudoniella acicularis]|uniref:Heterokaryon incompatibility domain-containing protein n=1 Tax=Cudoniella acicularis TaxID=354080 RepID=A0A8H4W5Q0_9HELO|nr:hypothetical protein G7Y89_g2896 [Cudoniella acicularis]
MILPQNMDFGLATVDVEMANAKEEDIFEIEVNFVCSFNYSDVHCLRGSTSSRHAFGTISNWLRNCHSNHAKCRYNQTSFYPSRLLYLGKEGVDIKLVVTAIQQPRGPYLTLSHRWGSEDYTKLESSTIHQFQCGIDISTLPLTFQDAIEVTRRLGFQYLWIDSLCIMQDEDDKSDWQYESPKMGEIYSNALLNLSATSATNSSSSLFVDRDLGTILPSPIELNIGGTIQQYHLFDGKIWEDEVTCAPLNRRGWVFQERILARRVLHFGRRQLAWECRQLDAMEIFPHGLPLIAGSTLQKKEVGFTLEGTSPQVSPKKNQKAYSLWQEMVEAYSECSLTRSEDKLVALSVLAKSMRDATSDEYVAGMWRRTMAFDLPWWRETESRKLYPINGNPYRAPSWSWASVDGRINFPGMPGTSDEEFIEVLGTNLSYVSNEDITTGCLLDGSSMKMGVLLNTLVLHDLLEDDTFSALIISGIRFDLLREASISFLHPEISSHELADYNNRNALYCVACCVTRSELCGILLTSYKQDQPYHRIGSFSVDISVKLIEEDGAVVEEELDHRAITNALTASSKAGYFLPCDFYDEKSGRYTITII